MQKLLQRLIKFLAYVTGGILILLAIAVGLFRLFLPRLPEYQEDIKDWASAAIGMQVEFSGMDARWGLSGPELEFYDAELIAQDSMARIVAADEVSIGLALTRLLFDRKAVVDRVVVRDTSIEVRQLANGQWFVQGSPLEQLVPARSASAGENAGNGRGSIEIVGEDIQLQFLQPGDERPRLFQIATVRVQRDDVRMAIDADVELPDDLGRSLTVAATQLQSLPAEERSWDISAELDDVRLAGVTALQPFEAVRFASGRGDVDVSLSYSSKKIQSVTADVDIKNISIAGLSDLALSGRLEFLNDTDGWLVAANEFRATTPAGDWPVSTLRLETGTDTDGKIVMLDARASYLNFAHVAVARPWLNEQQRSVLDEFDPSGVVRDLAVTLSDLDTAAPRFSIAAEMVDVGVAAYGKRPGVRGFSGSIRADHSSGLLEIGADKLVVTYPDILGQPLAFDTTSGTVIWRRSNNRTTVLSDSIILRNEFFENETSIELSLADSGGAPIIDLESKFSVSDIAAARRFVPYMAKRPRMSQWFQEGLISGRVERGTVRLYGPMDKWPFDEGEGQLLIEGNVRDAVVLYQPKWPAARVIDADIAIENMRLYSTRSHVINAGNEIINAKLEIADFRNPHLTLSALATGTLESLRQLSIQSPIGEMFGGQLDRISVSGDASVDLDIDVPVRDWQSFSFTALLQTSNGSLQFEGFNPPLQEMSGIVTIERENISSESLGGLFLGKPVSIELSQAPETMPKYRVIADATGAATAEALIEELGLPLSSRVAGQADYSAKLLFPRGNIEEPAQFTIEVASDLAGYAIDLPQPFNKPLYDTIDFAASIFLPKGGELIESTGVAGDLLSWQLAFVKQEDRWDLDRGVLALGVEPEIEAVPETRGLHLRGNTDYVHVQEWFDLARSAETKTGMAERIRSIDMTVSNLHMLGQHLVDHRLRVDRSARDWLVQVDGADIIGSASVPYDFNSEREIVVEAERLVLPGDDKDLRESTAVVDPRSLPPISIKSQETAFGSRFFGAVDAKFVRTADGLESQQLTAKDETFDVVGNARWVVDETDPEGHRSFVTASLTSTDVERTMRRLDYDPGIVGDDLAMLLDLSWSGGPRDDMLESLDGEVQVRIGSGKLSDVKPGAGRVFGLMSIAALPRRLALDFRDVFGKGFAFDKIKGTFMIVDGDTYTCDLLLESPAADIGIVGRAGLVSRDYEQTAVVSASFGNALPVAGALVAGPQVAAALLIFSQIFKKPLQEVTQVYYDVGGTWDEPQIETTTAEFFALSGVKMGCINQSE
ncbi:MAG: YhdP family protein [Gammaproteobacteria bacterium]|nr:YhdP family protein [Gammaproteobacteria bacterium]